jgi:sugar lactone lactonase YvrE
MNRMRIALVIAATLASGCGKKVTGIVFSVDASAPVSGIARLHGTATLNGGASATIDLPHSPTVSIPPSATFALQLPDNATGSIEVQLQALADDGTVLASGGGSATIVAHGVQKDAHVSLTPTGTGLVFDATTNDFGTVTLAQMSQPFTFTATNMGTDQTGTPMVTIDGADAGDFAFTTACSDPVAVAGTCTIAVTFAPTAVGARAATLHLTATPGGEATAMLAGTGMMPSGAAFAIAPKTFLFTDTPETMTGNSNSFTVTNIGGAASPTLGNSTIVGGMTGSYAITTDGCFAKVLQPNDTCMVAVQFKPLAAGMQASTLTVAGAGATLNGRGQGTYHAEANMNGGPGPGTFWYGAFAPSSDEIVATTTGIGVYFMTPGKPATLSAGSVLAASGAQLHQVWGPSKGSVYIVDDKGEVLHNNGGTGGFSLFNTGNIEPAGCCTGIWGFSDTNFYVVGGATAAHYDGTWHTQTVSATTPVLNAVWASAPNNLYAVGNGGLIVHNDGSSATWTLQTSGTTADLKAIYGSAANDIYAVGSTTSAVPVILHYDGTAWTEQSSGLLSAQLNTVFVAADGEAWIGDLQTVALYSNGNGMWTNVTSVGNLEKWQITGTSDHDVYIFSEDGNIFHYY